MTGRRKNQKTAQGTPNGTHTQPNDWEAVIGRERAYIDALRGISPTRQDHTEGKTMENGRESKAKLMATLYRTLSQLQERAYMTNDKVLYAYATQMLDSRLMDLKANYSKEA